MPTQAELKYDDLPPCGSSGSGTVHSPSTQPMLSPDATSARSSAVSGSKPAGGAENSRTPRSSRGVGIAAGSAAGGVMDSVMGLRLLAGVASPLLGVARGSTGTLHGASGRAPDTTE